MRDVAVWPAICWRRWSPAGHSPEHVGFRLERPLALSRCGDCRPSTSGFFSGRRFTQVFRLWIHPASGTDATPSPRNSPHDRSRLLLARLPGSGEMERMGRWAHVTGRPVSVWLVVPQVQQRMSPALCWSTVYIQPGCPCVIDSSPPLAVFATKSQPDPSSNLSVPSCALPSHPAQRHPQILSPSAEFFQDDRPISAFSFLPACPSSPSSQSPAYRASSIKRAPGRSRPTVQQDSKNQHHPAIRVAPHYQIKLSMRTIRP